MGKVKTKKQMASRFVVGRHGGCEARLFRVSMQQGLHSRSQAQLGL
jgi:hypothetical protein